MITPINLLCCVHCFLADEGLFRGSYMRVPDNIEKTKKHYGQRKFYKRTYVSLKQSRSLYLPFPVFRNLSRALSLARSSKQHLQRRSI